MKHFLFDPEEILILNEIANIQIQSYNNIIEGSLLKEEENILLQFQSSLEEAENEAKWRIKQYKELLKEPLYLGIMDNRDLQVMRHLLFRIEDIYPERLETIMKLWDKFLTIEEERSPEIQLSLKLKKKKKKTLSQIIKTI